jgi:ASCH domain
MSEAVAGVKYHPILLAASWVRLILDGRKTQTRRLNRHRGGCPLGEPGHRLWVREPFRVDDDLDVFYAADGGRGPWTSARHMPRSACRLELIVRQIREERLFDLTTADAMAEGMVRRRGARKAFFRCWDETYSDCPSADNPRVWAAMFEATWTFRSPIRRKRKCRVCGCTDEWGCDEGCEWVELDLCSACVAKQGEVKDV